MLKRLIESATAAMPNTVVVPVTSIGVIGEFLRAEGVKVHALGMSLALNFPMML